MGKKHFTIASLISIVLLTVMLVPTSSQGADYDPWADINEDGNIDIYDVAYEAQRFGTSGDPTKNVNVTNWPVGNDVTVWYTEPFAPSQMKYSPRFSASGFGHLHVLARGYGLGSGESLDVYVDGIILADPQNPQGSGWLVLAHSVTLVQSAPSTSFTIPVPSAQFYFEVRASSVTTADVYLSFYLTWA